MVASLFWRPVPVLTLTVRQFVGGKAVRVVTILSLIPALFAAIYLINPDISTPQKYLTDTIFLNLVAPTLLPITVLILATGALGNELEDRTLPYLTLKPIGRWRIVVEKFIGTIVVLLPTILAGLAIAFLLVARGDAGDMLRLLWAMLAAAAVAIVATSAVFLLISLVIPRALVAGIVYTFLWESLLGRFLPGTHVVSIHQYVASIFAHLTQDPAATKQVTHINQVSSSLWTLGIVSVIALALATWRLRRMNLE